MENRGCTTHESSTHTHTLPHPHSTNFLWSWAYEHTLMRLCRYTYEHLWPQTLHPPLPIGIHKMNDWFRCLWLAICRNVLLALFKWQIWVLNEVNGSIGMINDLSHWGVIGSECSIACWTSAVSLWYGHRELTKIKDLSGIAKDALKVLATLWTMDNISKAWEQKQMFW